MPAVVLSAAVLLRIVNPPWLEETRLRVFDLFQRLAPRASVEGPVRIVDIDDETLSRVGQWPWSRTRVAELVDRLAASHVAVIAFDVLFAEPDRTSPARVLLLWPSTPDVDAVRGAV